MQKFPAIWYWVGVESSTSAFVTTCTWAEQDNVGYGWGLKRRVTINATNEVENVFETKEQSCSSSLEDHSQLS